VYWNITFFNVKYNQGNTFYRCFYGHQHARTPSHTVML